MIARFWFGEVKLVTGQTHTSTVKSPEPKSNAALDGVEI
jgi:hypothetical protein